MVTPIIARIPIGVDRVAFLERLTIEFGQSAEDLQSSVRETLVTKGSSIQRRATSALCKFVFSMPASNVPTWLVGGGAFRSTELFRRPLLKKRRFKIEFSARLAGRATVTDDLPKHPDELFLVNVPEDAWVRPDVNVHEFQIERLSDLEHALQLREKYD